MRILFLVIAVFFLSILFLSNSSQHPTNPNGGFTGAPLDGVCTQCHRNSNNNLSGSFEISGVPEIAFPGYSYPIIISISNPEKDGLQAGFQLVAIEDDLSGSGTFETEDENALLKRARGREYVGHSPALRFDNNGNALWDALWKPSENELGNVTFYGAGMIGNGQNGNSGDRPIFRQWAGEVKDSTEGIVIETSIIQYACSNTDSGVLSADRKGGVSPISYKWNTGDTTMTAEDLPPGSYEVVAFDAVGNSDTSAIVIPEINSLEIDDIKFSAPSEKGSDGSIELIVSGGVEPYNIMWTDLDGDTLAFGTALRGINEGNYIYSITDLSQCFELRDTIVLDRSTSSPRLEKKIFTVYPNPASTHIYLSDEMISGHILIRSKAGEMMYKGDFQNSRINLPEDLPRGLYFISIYSTKKLIHTSKITVLDY